MGEAAATLSDLAIVTSDNPRTEDPLAIIGEVVGGIRTTQFGRPADWLDRGGERGYLVVPDRREAIATAIGLAGSSDIVLIAGKGHEDYQIIGTRKLPFDDREIARLELARRSAERDRP